MLICFGLSVFGSVRRFHVLLKRQAQLKRKLSPATSQEAASTETGPSSVALKKELGEVEKEMVGLGGLEWYQRGATSPPPPVCPLGRVALLTRFCSGRESQRRNSDRARTEEETRVMSLSTG